MSQKEKINVRFEEAVLPHLDAYNLERWLNRDPADVDDVMQEAYLRAFKFFHGFRSGNSRAWFLKIVRNTSRLRFQAGLTSFLKGEPK